MLELDLGWELPDFASIGKLAFIHHHVYSYQLPIIHISPPQFPRFPPHSLRSSGARLCAGPSLWFLPEQCHVVEVPGLGGLGEYGQDPRSGETVVPGAQVDA